MRAMFGPKCVPSREGGVEIVGTSPTFDVRYGLDSNKLNESKPPEGKALKLLSDMLPANVRRGENLHFPTREAGYTEQKGSVKI